jgi:hypothetical protein
MKAVPAGVKRAENSEAATHVEGKPAVDGAQPMAPAQAYLFNLASKINRSPRVSAQLRLSEQFQRSNADAGPVAFPCSADGSETPATGRPVAQRILEIETGKDNGTFDSAGDLPKKLTIPKRLGDVREKVLTILGGWADLKEETKTFKNWPLAIDAAGEEATRPVVKEKPKKEEHKKEHVDKEESSSGEDQISDVEPERGEVELRSLDLPESTLDITKTKTLYFTDKGDFADEEGERLSRSKALQLANSLSLSHVYQGHGPDITDESLRSSALTSGVSGKWSTDFDAISAVVAAYQEIALGNIVPGPEFKIIDTGALNSVNYRRRGPEGKYVLFPSQASKAKVGFKKQSLGKGAGHYYSLKTVFPFPEKVDDTGALLGY